MRFWCKGVATTHLALGVITVLIMFGPAVEAQAQVPDRPELYTVHPGHRYLTVSVESRGSVVPPTSFKLQWKSGNQDYDTSRQKINSVTPNDNDVDNAERATFWLLGLTNGVEYSFRAFATNEHGDSPPSFQRTGTPFYAPDKDASLWGLRYYYDSEYKGDFLLPQVLGEAQERVHSVVVRPSTESITILALPQYQGESNRPGATVEYDPADADDTARFHQTSLIEGENVITVTVTSADRSTTSTHTITVTRPSVATQPSNLEPTGLPTIAGTARVGETLTASVSEIADSDGLGGATFTYQWIRSDGATDTEIADATQASYTLVPTDQGKTIKVRATFTDDGGTEEALTSAATAVVQDSPLLSVSDARATEGALVEFTVSLSAASGQQVTVQYATADGTAESGADFTPASGTLTFAANETSKSVYVATGRDAVDEENETFTLRLSNASGASIADGEATGTISDEESPFVSVPQIDGIPQVGNTLEVSFADPPSGALAYQWLRGSEVIAGATASTHVPTVADLGARLSVRVESGGDSVTSKATAPVWPAPANPPLADGEEELLSATVTLGSHQFPYWVAGYGRVLGESFGEMDVTSFEDGGATYAVDSFLVNSSGVFGLSTGSTLPDASGLVAYWNGYRISGLDEDAVKRGKLPMLVGRTPQPSTEYSRYEDGASDGVQVAVSLRRVSAEAQNALTASFEGVPAAHDGESGFRFRVAFSEPIAISFRSLREDAFAVTGGRVTRGTRVDRRKDLFEITVEPDGGGELTIALPAGRECSVSGAICTWGPPRKQLTNTPTATVAGPDRAPANAPAEGAPTIAGTPRVGGTLSASTSGITDADGLDDARFAYQWIRANSDIQGVTGSTYTAVEADEGERLKVRVSFTDDAGHAESLTSAATDAVAARPAPLTASFEDVPVAHDGESAFTLRIASSDRLSMMNGRRLREDVVAVSGGRATSAGRVNRRRDLWRLTVEPDSLADVTVTLAAGAACDSPAAVCTKDGRALSNTISATVRGPVGISVADAHVEEDAGAVLAFAVTLSRAASRALTVDYATSDGSAQAGVDYTAASGTLTFQAGESSRTIEVGVLDDAHDEGEETLTLTLSSASGGLLTDGEATGTIENRDPLPRALLARFGRTAAVHVVEHVEERLQAPREPGFRGRFAGRELRRGMESEMALNFLRQLGGAAGAGPRGTGPVGAGVGGPMGSSPAAGTAPRGMPGASGGGALMMGAGGLNGGGFLQMGLGGGDLLTGSDFAMNRESRGGILSFWSRGAQSRFSGREGALSLGGDVRTTMFGADYARGPLVAGLSLSNSRGLGEYAGAAGGQVASSVTGLYPWLGYKMTERVTVWGVAGYGAGGLRLTPDGGPALEAGLSMAMAAAGTRGELVAGGASGFALAFKADALWVGTAIDGVDGPAGRLKATDAAVTRFRTGLEGSRAYTLAGRLSLTPSVEVGLRHDGGDAETGAGMDVGAGLVVSDAGTGLAVDVRVRTLLVHQDEDFSERGVAVSLSYNPTPQTPLGFVARVAPSWGGAGDERGRGAVGPGDDGGDGARRRRAGQPVRWRGRLRAAGGEPLRGDAAGRRQHLRIRARLPAGLWPDGGAARRHARRAGRRRPPPRASDAGRRGHGGARPGRAGLVRRGAGSRRV